MATSRSVGRESICAHLLPTTRWSLLLQLIVFVTRSSEDMVALESHSGRHTHVATVTGHV